MSIAGKTVLVTGTSRGIGQALVEEALKRGARRVYAAARRPAGHPDERVTPLRMDVTDAAQVRTAADPLAQSLADGWRGGAVKAFERQLAELR